MNLYKVTLWFLLHIAFNFPECEGRPFVWLIPMVGAVLAPVMGTVCTWSGMGAAYGAVAGTMTSIMAGVTTAAAASSASFLPASSANAGVMASLAPAVAKTALADTVVRVGTFAKDTYTNRMPDKEKLQENLKQGIQYTANNKEDIKKNLGVMAELKEHLAFIRKEADGEIRFTPDTSERLRKAVAAKKKRNKLSAKKRYETKAEATAMGGTNNMRLDIEEHETEQSVIKEGGTGEKEKEGGTEEKGRSNKIEPKTQVQSEKNEGDKKDSDEKKEPAKDGEKVESNDIHHESGEHKHTDNEAEATIVKKEK